MCKTIEETGYQFELLCSRTFLDDTVGSVRSVPLALCCAHVALHSRHKLLDPIMARLRVINAPAISAGPG